MVIYRLIFHPLANVPGPRLAALSRLYDFYFDCILGGKFSFKIDELHDIYGKFQGLDNSSIVPCGLKQFNCRAYCTNRPK